MERLTDSVAQNWPVLLLLTVLAAAFLILRTSPSQMVDVAAFDRAVAAGRPTVVEFYSNF